MANGLQGADVEGLRALSKQFIVQADQLKGVATRLTGQLGSSPWQGPDSHRFRGDWSQDYQPLLLAAGARLREAAQELARNADEQERASEGTGGAGGALEAAAAAAAAAVAGAAGTGAPPSSTTDPQANRDWWDALSAQEQRDWIKDNPELIGGMDGLPGQVRDAANRARLPELIAAAQAQAQANPGDAGIAKDLEGLLALEKLLGEHENYQLLMVDSSGHPLLAAVANGNIDNADRLVTHVPGTTSNVAGMPGSVDRLNNLTDEARRQLRMNGDYDSSVVGVAWQGYDAPDDILSQERIDAAQAELDGMRPQPGDWRNPIAAADRIGSAPGRAFDVLNRDGGTTQDALNSQFAQDGGPALAQFGDGLRVNTPDVRSVVDAHSYGAAVAGNATMRTDAFDAFISSGGPGTFATDVSQLQVRDGLFVSEARWRDQDYVSKIDLRDLPGSFGRIFTDSGDIVPDIEMIDPQNRFGTDPSRLDGAHVFDNSAVGADGRHGDLSAAHGHSSYWEQESHSLYNSGAVVAGYPEEADTL